MQLKRKPDQGQIYVKKGGIIVNCLPVTSLPTHPFYQYDEFKDNMGERGRFQIIDQLQLQNTEIFTPRSTYDRNKNLFSPHVLQFKDSTKEYEFTVRVGRKEHVIRIKFAREIHPNQMQLLHSTQWQQDRNLRLNSITLLNLLVRMHPSTIQGVVTKGRGFFSKEGKSVPRVSHPIVEFWSGFFQSVRPALNRVVLNVDTTVTLMYHPGSVLDALFGLVGVNDVRLLHQRCEQPRYRKQIKRYLKGLRVKFTHRDGARPRSIGDIAWQSANEYEFEKDGQPVTVSEYFAQMNRPLKFGYLGALACFGKESRVPLELLEIIGGQPFKGAIPESAQADFLKFATKGPVDRLNNLRQSLGQLHHQDSPFMGDAGLSIEQRLMEVSARVIKPPVLDCRQRIELGPGDAEKGAWNMMRKQVLRAATLGCIIVVKTDNNLRTDVCNAAIQRLVDVLADLGIVLTPGFQTVTFEHYGQSLEAKLDSIIQEGQSNNRLPPVWETLVVVVVQESQRSTRECVKWWGDVRMGAITQILKSSKLRQPDSKGFDQYARNVGLKINCKMRGLNFVPNLPPIPQFAEPGMMIVGIDTSHPTDINHPTTAALVYSIDRYGCNYRAVVRFQPARREIVDDLQNMMEEALKGWRDANEKKWVQRVIVYRDGVSEGQFEQVVDAEIAAIQRAFDDQFKYSSKTYGHNVQPELTFIVVGKKHHVRMLPADPSMVDRNQNALPGTIVDTDITTPEPGVFDFYMQSHGSILGTSRPAHYSVIRDDLQLTADQLQALSHTLCHVYQIATRSVSIPAPVYYADQVAARSAFQFYELNNDNASINSEELNYAWWADQIERGRGQLHLNTLNRMYWL